MPTYAYVIEPLKKQLSDLKKDKTKLEEKIGGKDLAQLTQELEELSNREVNQAKINSKTSEIQELQKLNTELTSKNNKIDYVNSIVAAHGHYMQVIDDYLLTRDPSNLEKIQPAAKKLAEAVIKGENNLIREPGTGKMAQIAKFFKVERTGTSDTLKYIRDYDQTMKGTGVDGKLVYQNARNNVEKENKTEIKISPTEERKPKGPTTP